jgi:DNA-binding LacI/PurR family transcriptional regulator
MHASVSHLIRHGHRRIAFVSVASNLRRAAGYRRALSEHGLPVDDRLTRTWTDRDGTLSSARLRGYHAIRELLEEQVPFTAVQAGSDFTAVGAIDALEEAGRRVPADTAVAGFDNVDEMGASPLRTPFLTTVHDPNREMGRKAAELLLAQIEEGAAPQRVVLPTQLVIRSSCGAHVEAEMGRGAARGGTDHSVVLEVD